MESIILREKVIKRIILCHYWVQNFILDAIKRILFDNQKILNSKNILIFRTGSMGDSICALPTIYSIRKNFPLAKIDILTNASTNNLVSIGNLIDRSLVNEIISYTKDRANHLIRRLRKGNYDLFIQLPHNWASLRRQTRDIFFAKAIGANSAFGWQIAATRFLAIWQERLIEFESERDRLMHILERNGLKNYGLKFPLGINDAHKSKVNQLIIEQGLTDKGKNIAMVVGAKRPQNRWPIENFAEVLKNLTCSGKNIFLVGGKDDIELAKKIEGENVFNYCGILEPLETAELFKYCSLTISNDTGPMHLSYAVGTPVIAIFSGRDYPDKWFPPKDQKNIVIRNSTGTCKSCFNVPCDNLCLKQIIPGDVLKKIEDKLEFVYG
jgi:lipopolysaccharide heptosyltransferase II